MLDLNKLDEYTVRELQQEIDSYKNIVKSIRKVINKKKKEELKESLINKQGV
jgi:hypothetical protein